jgi:hypothetical protein
VLGPWVNRPWLNALSTVIVSILFVLSLILMTTTIFPGIDVPALVVALAVTLGAVLAVAGVLYWRSLWRKPLPPREDRARRDAWRMPPVALLERPTWSRGRTLTMYLMYGYLVVAVVLLVVKAVRLGLHA